MSVELWWYPSNLRWYPSNLRYTRWVLIRYSFHCLSFLAHTNEVEVPIHMLLLKSYKMLCR